MNEQQKNELVKLIENDTSLKKNKALDIKSGNEWIQESKNTPIPKQLFDCLWYEGELCILYADANLGKSILAVQIGDSISKGKSFPGFKSEVEPQKVLYLDFELSSKQFEKRYSDNYQFHYQWSDNFYRAEIKQDLELDDKSKSFEELILSAIKQGVIDENVQVVIVDNITFLNTDNEKGKNALDLMKRLKKLKQELGISMLILAHTPKRNQYAPLSKNDLSGSRQIMNFCDSSFAIGESAADPQFRYIKQIKQRNTECIYHAHNIIVCQIKLIDSFLGFHFIQYDDEVAHLKQADSSDLELRDEQIAELKSEGFKNTEIGRRLGISEGTVRSRLKKMGA
tara:strand:- start:360 stop:1379 length:1020 start_codon:yes stop_codon:yes gene_type:complete